MGRPDAPILTTSRNADLPIRLLLFAIHRGAIHLFATLRYGEHPNATRRSAILPDGVHPNDSTSLRFRHLDWILSNGTTTVEIHQNAATHHGTNLMRDGEIGQKAWLTRLRGQNAK